MGNEVMEPMAETKIDPRAFRDAMGCFATGITVISALTTDGEPVGMTVNSFSSVSLDPPLILYSLARSASRFNEFARAERFVVNVLGQSHEPLSTRFATRGVSGWEDVAHDRCEDGCPALADALAVFECVTEARHDGGDHVIVVGRVERVRQSPAGEPLLFYRGAYSRIATG
ncbi:MAG: flavin reductase family protein [Alphaproteobacteria bacterium]